LIKGGGAAHLREKVVARCAKRFVVIADGSKLVPVLGTFKLPVEVVPFALPAVLRELAAMGARCVVRASKSGASVLTDNGNFVVDADFFPIEDPAGLAARLDAIPGIAEHGLFVGMAERLVMGLPDGSVKTVFPRAR
jgi:ribose 5-phosphate isomerase A